LLWLRRGVVETNNVSLSTLLAAAVYYGLSELEKDISKRIKAEELEKEDRKERLEFAAEETKEAVKVIKKNLVDIIQKFTEIHSGLIEFPVFMVIQPMIFNSIKENPERNNTTYRICGDLMSKYGQIPCSRLYKIIKLTLYKMEAEGEVIQVEEGGWAAAVDTAANGHVAHIDATALDG
jgi:hypothetical protein